MKKYLAFVFLPIAAFWGCATMRMRPVQGPLSAQPAPPVYEAKINAKPYSYSQTLSTTLNDGERVKVPMNMAVNAGPVPPSLEAEWDSVYGTGYYRFKVLESQLHLRGIATGSKGTVLQVEVYENEIRPVPALKNDDSYRIDVHGVAKDNNGNVYKLEFQ